MPPRHRRYLLDRFDLYGGCARQLVACIAPDLIGFGDSDKLADAGPDSYQFVENRICLDGLPGQFDLGDSVTLVVRDWGSGLGFHWARRHPDRIAAITYLEANVAPRLWSQLSPIAIWAHQTGNTDH